MTEFTSDKFSWRIEQGDALTVLAGMEADSVDCVCTSPPYWSLRDYGAGTATVWGGEPECEHEWETTEVKKSDAAVKQGPQSVIVQSHTEPKEYSHDTCQKCGAWHGQLGLEPHPSLYLEHLLEIFDEVKRVLKPTGCCFVNMGDTYFGGGGYSPGAPSNIAGSISSGAGKHGAKTTGATRRIPAEGNWLKPKNLLMIPSRFAIGMSERGWWIRNDNAWHKPNAMPSSVKDRFSCTWEHVYFFTKSAKYWFDLDAVREAYTSDAEEHDAGVRDWEQPGLNERGAGAVMKVNPLGKNPGDCWIIPTFAFPESHFATFPPELIRKPIRAGCPAKCCVECGKPWERIVEPSEDYQELVRPPRPSPEHVGTYLNEQRQAMGLSIREVAKHFPSATGGLTGIVWNWENGLMLPSPKAYGQLKDLLGLDNRFDELLEEPETGGGWIADDVDVAREGNRKTGTSTTASYKTVGWQPTCECGTQTCTYCESVVEYTQRGDYHANRKTKSTSEIHEDQTSRNLPAMRERLHGKEDAEVLQPTVRNQELGGHGEDSPLEAGARVASPIPQGAETSQLQGLDDRRAGLQAGSHSRASDGESAGLCARTSASDVKAFGTLPNEGGAGSSSERGQTGQSNRESGDSKRSVTSARNNSDLSSLREGVCPDCGHPVVHKPEATRPGTVLDPFAGSGTTGLVCIQEDRNYIGIELSEEYCEMQHKRLERATRSKQHKLPLT